MKITLAATAFAIFILPLAVPAPAAPQSQPTGVPNSQNGSLIPGPGEELPPETSGSEIFQWKDKDGDTSRKGNLRTLRAGGGGSGVSELPEAAFGDPFIGAPRIIAGEIDVLPAERRDMLQQGGVEGP